MTIQQKVMMCAASLVVGAFAAATVPTGPAGHARAATAVEYSVPDLGSRVGGSESDSLPGSDKIPCTPGGLC